jgi:hypothetical protein
MGYLDTSNAEPSKAPRDYRNTVIIFLVFAIFVLFTFGIRNCSGFNYLQKLYREAQETNKRITGELRNATKTIDGLEGIKRDLDLENHRLKRIISDIESAIASGFITIGEIGKTIDKFESAIDRGINKYRAMGYR